MKDNLFTMTPEALDRKGQKIRNYKKNSYYVKGKMIYADGSEYDGDFQIIENRGMPYPDKHGVGKMIYSDGSKYLGEFKFGNFNGHGFFEYSNGNKYRGGFKDGLYYGYGSLILSNSQEISGNWLDGKLIKEF